MPEPERAAVAEWTALLDRFERALAADAAEPWAPAATPLPAELAGRARRVLAAQRERVATLTHERDEARSHLLALRRIPAEPDQRSAYLDLDG
jgi:hypothetical protein